ncbi:MAG TPA: hypothetical protein VE645_14010, partial [Pseudonocardiaceae bacterium]|nr:hypothetical protein [Pseudonocardiaceae bacterium]
GCGTCQDCTAFIITPKIERADERGKRDPNRRVIHIHCSVHGGPRGFTNLVCTKSNGDVELDQHVSGGCVIVFRRKAATELFDTLGQ